MKQSSTKRFCKWKEPWGNSKIWQALTQWHIAAGFGAAAGELRRTAEGGDCDYQGTNLGHEARREHCEMPMANFASTNHDGQPSFRPTWSKQLRRLHAAWLVNNWQMHGHGSASKSKWTNSSNQEDLINTQTCSTAKSSMSSSTHSAWLLRLGAIVFRPAFWLAPARDSRTSCSKQSCSDCTELATTRRQPFLTGKPRRCCSSQNQATFLRAAAGGQSRLWRCCASSSSPRFGTRQPSRCGRCRDLWVSDPDACVWTL